MYLCDKLLTYAKSYFKIDIHKKDKNIQYIDTMNVKPYIIKITHRYIDDSAIGIILGIGGLYFKISFQNPDFITTLFLTPKFSTKFQIHTASFLKYQYKKFIEVNPNKPGGF